jgi:hypothetical protein
MLLKTSKEEKMSCRDCAYLDSGVFAFDLDNPEDKFELLRCRQDNSSIKGEELDTKTCKKFMRKKKGMTLEQQEHSRLTNRLRRNWDKVTGLIISLILAVIAILKFVFHI